MNTSPFRRAHLAALVIAATAACSADGVTDPGSQYSTLVVNASTSTAYVTLGDVSTLATVTGDPTMNTAWDLAFTAVPTVAVNGGASGAAGVKAYCLCQNANLSLTQVEALTATNGANAFGGVTTSSVVADNLFQVDAASQAISGWYDYNATTHIVSANSTVWGIRLASTAGAYAKFHVSAIPTPGQANAGPVTIQWAIQPTSSGTMGADKTLTLDLSSNAKLYVNLTTSSVSTTSTGTWDIALQGYTITVNGGANGTGNVGAVALVPSSFYTSYASITAIPVGATGIPSTSFVADAAGGAFLAAPPYRYDPVAHQVYPTYDVYLVKRGTTVYKVQVVSYYSSAGVFGVITLRYAKVSG